MKHIIEHKNKLFVGVLVGIIVIMMAQNYLLVKKNEQHLKRIESLTEERNRGSTMNEGDSLRAFVALCLDSSAVLINPRNDGTQKLLLVFTTWCGACLENLGQWKRSESDIASLEIQIIGLCPDSLFKVREYCSKNSLTFPVYSILGDSSIARDFKLHSFPQTILVDSSGLVKRTWAGLLSNEWRDSVEAMIRVEQKTF